MLVCFVYEALLFQIPIRWCSSEPIFKVQKKIIWDESFEQQARTEPETSSALQAVGIIWFFILVE